MPRCWRRSGSSRAQDEQAIRAGLAAIAHEIETGRFPFDAALEDIHMNIEARLTERIGEAGRRLHTARSRNDQVATDFRLWVRDAIDGLTAQVTDVMRALADRAAAHAADPMPGFTHLQTAQPVTFGHHLLAYVEMLDRDRGRLADCRRRLNECPLGSAALAGTSFPIDRHDDREGAGLRPAHRQLARRGVGPRLRAGVPRRGGDLGDAPVALRRGDRDLVLARPGGSSGCPTRSPPAARSCRRSATPTPPSWCAPRPGGSPARWSALLTVMKGLPLAYAKDMQEDKEPVFDAAEAWALSLAAIAGMVRDMTPDTARMRELAGSGFATATDLADWLVRVLKLPFRDAHHVTGRLVAPAEAQRRRPRRPDAGRDAGGGATHHRRRVHGADGRGIGRVAHQLRRHRAGQRRARGGALAAGAGVRRAAAAVAAGAAAVAACGKKGPPSPPGPPDQITWPRVYPTH